MRKIIVTNIVSLDGYYEGPGGNVMALPMDEAFDAYNLARMQQAGSVLLGRTSFEFFSAYWPGVADHPEEPEENRAYSPTNRELSRGWNRLPKVVVSDTYRLAADHPWHDTTTVVARDRIGAWVEAQREQSDDDIVVFGSHMMWNGLLQQGMVDELHLMVGSSAFGDGTPIFTAPVDGLRSVDARQLEGSDNVLLVYAAR